MNDQHTASPVGTPRREFGAMTADEIWQSEYMDRFRPANPSGTHLRICFLIGSADISGGTYVIFEHATAAQSFGAEVVIVPLLPMSHAADGWHRALAELRFASLDEIADTDFDVVVATWWRTVYELPRLKARHYAYFVQSVESRFYSKPEEQRAIPFVERTYKFDLRVITITRYLQAYLGFEHQRPAFLVRNGVSKELYSPYGPVVEPRPKNGLRVLVEGPVGVPLKNVERSVELAREAGVEEVWLLTSSAIEEHPGVDRVFSRLQVEACAHVYRSCDVLLKLSKVEGMFGPPLEMFHCGGTAITYPVTGHDEYLNDGYNSLIVEMDDEAAVRTALQRIRADRSFCDRLRLGAMETADRWPDWERATTDFWDLLRLIARLPARDYRPTLQAVRAAGAAL